jgi:hypothetical protein
MPNLDEHITFKELKAARTAIQSFLPELKGKHLLLQEKNQSVIGVLTHTPHLEFPDHTLK